VTEFRIEARHYCRNPKCRSKLPSPVTNLREAFCCRGCHSGFYRHRCLVCEGPLDRTRENQRVCRKAKCRSAWRARSEFGRYIGPSDANKAPKILDSIGSKPALRADRPWRMAAGRITAAQYHGATVSDAPHGALPNIRHAYVWSDGDWQRNEARNRKLLADAGGVSAQSEPKSPTSTLL
jgi:hypothetical protein